MLNQTPRDLLVDSNGRPYFLWDSEMTLDEFREGLNHEKPALRGYLLGKLMRQSKPDDVFLFVSIDTICSLWRQAEPHLGDKAAFWRWLLCRWGYNVEN